jgi:hypothetical protein
LIRRLTTREWKIQSVGKASERPQVASFDHMAYAAELIYTR